jgi:hypothetical protein
VVFVIAGVAAILALYLVHPIVSGYRYPIGPDGPVYTWLTRYAGAAGFQDAPAGGPGVPGLALVLSAALGAKPLEVITILGPVLAVACGMAAAGTLESLLGRSPVLAAAAALMVAAFTAPLAGGWLANVTMVALFVAALGALGLVSRSWRAASGASGLIAAAGLAHRVFLMIGLVIVGLVIAGQLPDYLRQRQAGVAPWRIPGVRMAVAAVAGSFAAFLGLLGVAGGIPLPGDTSQDGFFRRLGLRDLLMDRYRERLGGEWSRAAVPIAAGAVLGGTGLFGRDRPRSPEATYLRGVIAAWAGVTVAGLPVLLLTGWGPPNRLMQFAFFLPLAAAVGLASLAGLGGWRAGAAILAAVAFVSFSMGGWYRHSPAVESHELAASSRAGAVAATLPPETPLVFLVDTSEAAAAYHVTRFANVLRMGVPASRIPHVRVAVGQPGDFLRGRLTLTGDEEHDRLARAYDREVEPVRDRAAVLVIREFNPAGYPQAVAAGTEATPGVAALPGPVSVAPVASEPRPPVGLGMAGWIGLSLAALGGLILLGGGWARWSFPGAGPRAVAGLAPSAGIAVAILGTFTADRLGVPVGGAEGLVGPVVLGSLGYAAAATRRRRPG